MDPIIAAIWILMLLVTLAVVVPVAVRLLDRALNAARNIERYTAEALASGVKIAENTGNIKALQNTISVAGNLLAGADAIGRNVASIEASIAAKAPGNGKVKHGEM